VLLKAYGVTAQWYGNLRSRENFQGAAVNGHSLGQQLRAFGASGLAALLQGRGAQAELGSRPRLRQLLARVDLQGAAESGHRLGQECRCLATFTPKALIVKRNAQFGLASRGSVGITALIPAKGN
jgi:hypothetical protein